MTSRAIVFVGLIRNPEKIGQFLDRLTATPAFVRGDLKLIVSTWEHELESYPELHAQLEAMGALIYTQQQPDLLLPGHIVHQIAALDLALADLDDAALVLKTRPDICDPDDIPILLRQELEPLDPDAPMPSPFRYRIWCKGGFPSQPFYLNDITFIAASRDLRMLPQLPMLTPFRYTNLGPEQLYWGSCFIPPIPAFDTYFRTNVGLVFTDEERARRLRTCLMDSPLYARALASYFLVIRDTFRMMNAFPDSQEVAERTRALTLEQILWEPVAVDGLNYNMAAFTNGVRSQLIWDCLAAGDFAPSPFGERVKAFRDLYDRPDAVAVMAEEAPSLRAEAVALVEQINAGVDASRFKHIQSDGTHSFIAQRNTNWQVAQTGTDLTASLEREINALRRRVQDLQSELTRRSGLNA